MKKTAMCLDLDGTLVTSQMAHVKAFQEAFTKNGYPKKSTKEILDKFGIPAKKIVTDFFPRAKPSDVLQIVDDKSKFFLDETHRYTKRIPGVVKALNELRSNFRLAIITNSTREEALVLLKVAKLPEEFFDSIVGVDQVKRPKPYADEIKKVARDLNTRVSYVVGDTVYDIQAGKAAGVKTVAVLSGHHSMNELYDAEPTLVVESIAQLPDALFD